MELELYTLGLVFTPLSILQKLALVDISWNYLLFFNLIVWSLIGIIYFFEKAVFK